MRDPSSEISVDESSESRFSQGDPNIRILIGELIQLLDDVIGLILPVAVAGARSVVATKMLS